MKTIRDFRLYRRIGTGLAGALRNGRIKASSSGCVILGKKINLEVFHALTDGTGALILLKRILAQYLTLCYPGQVSGEDPEFEWKACVPAMEEDSYLKLRDPSVPFRHGAGKKAYQIQGTRYLNARLDVTQGKCSASQVAALAKGMGVTVTAYLTGLLIHSIYTANGKFSKKPKPIVVSVPVNLRSLFPSQTLRNFFHFITVQVDYSQKEYTLKETVEQVATQLKEQADPSKLTAPLAFHVNAQYHLAVRFVPLFLKNWVLHLIYHLGEENYTSTLSNLGRMSLPEDEKPYVEHFEVLNNVTKRQCFKVGVCTLGDRMVVSFISGMEEKEIERWFFRHLSEQGIEVTIASNQPRVPDREG